MSKPFVENLLLALTSVALGLSPVIYFCKHKLPVLLKGQGLRNLTSSVRRCRLQNCGCFCCCRCLRAAKQGTSRRKMHANLVKVHPRPPARVLAEGGPERLKAHREECKNARKALVALECGSMEREEPEPPRKHGRHARHHRRPKPHSRL